MKVFCSVPGIRDLQKNTCTYIYICIGTTKIKGILETQANERLRPGKKKNETEIKVKIWQESEGRNERLGFKTKRTRQLRVEM